METTAIKLNTGAQFGRYEVLRLIGEGGMGAVYEARHLDLKKRVALKTLHPSVSQNEESRARFVREGEAASRIRHPHVVDVTDVGEQDGVAYLVMEYLEGESLASRLARGPVMSAQETADVLLPVFSAVAAGHDAGVIHRDLKPQNIFLEHQMRGLVVPKVLDFGVSKVAHPEGASSLTGTGMLLGTVSYMSPEQARGDRSLGHTSDQYALGLIMYECVTGRLAHEGENLLSVLHAIISGNFVQPSQVRQVDPAFEAIILRAMANSPTDRFADVRALGAAVLPFASERTRVLWSHEFGANASQASAPLPLPLPQPVSPSSSTKLLPSTSEERSRVAREQTASTEKVSSRPSAKVWAIVGGAVALLLVAAVLIVRPDERAAEPPQAQAPKVKQSAAVTEPPPPPVPVEVKESPPPPAPVPVPTEPVATKRKVPKAKRLPPGADDDAPVKAKRGANNSMILR